jgi:hypothetical protein
MQNEAISPKWTVYYLWFTVALISVFTILGYAKPEYLLSTWRAFTVEGSTDLTGPLGFWMARNLGFVLVALYALVVKSRDMVLAMLMFRVVVDFFDFFHWGILSGQFSGGIAPLVMTIVEVIAVQQLLSKNPAGNK